jgi:mRNA interferase HigB
MARIISVKYIKEFIDLHPLYAEPLRAFISIVNGSDWNKPQDIIKTFGAKSVDLIGNERIVIDVKGNKIRIIFKYQFPRARLFLKWIGTHSEYTKLCKKNEQHNIDLYK